MEPKFSPAGDCGVLVELGDVSDARLHASAAAVRNVGGVVACIVGQESLYVVFDGAPDRHGVANAIAAARESSVHPRRHEIEVSFAAQDAPDLPDLLSRASISRDEFLDRVRTVTLTARYLGFRAGFAYFDGWPVEWRMPRRPTSRVRVPRGSFAVAGPNAGFYPIDSPGGWNLLGRTAAPLWDARRDPPNLIAAGDEVAIVPVDHLGSMPDILEMPVLPRIEGIEIVSNAQFVTIVGRADWSRVEHGLAPGGAFDADAAALANQIAGNDANAPVVECAMLLPRIRFRRDAVIAWCGADTDLPQSVPIEVKPGDEIGGTRIRGGLRGWLAVRARGAVIPSREDGEESPAVLRRLAGDPSPFSRLGMTGERLLIRAIAGPHETSLREITCEVTPQLNRVGVRMRPLDRIPFEVPADLPSCGMQPGTIQLHPDGTIVAMGPDHPVTGGYLQPMTVLSTERWKLAQLAPGDKVRFVTSL